MAYLDTSILGSYYCPEALSAAVSRELLRLGSATISPLVEVEFLSLLSLKVRTGDLDRADADRVRRQFLKHRSNQLYGIVQLGEREYAVVRRWLSRFSTPLRTVDALHLAAAFVNGTRIWTTDKGMAASARGLRVACKLIAL